MCESFIRFDRAHGSLANTSAATASPGGRVESVQYRLSAAARVFKGHAFIATGLTDVSVGPTEELFRGGYAPLDSDLFPGG